ncbi:MAG: hypothetical protein RL335_1138, partial [Bacteroidota bacterium]
DGAKKKMDSVKPVAFRKIGFVEEKSGAVSAPTASSTNAAPKLTIKETKEEKQTAPNSVSPNQTKPVSLPPQPKFGNLQKIRDQISRKPQVEQNQIPLTQEKLQQAWELYVDKLLKANNPSAATNFRLAVLKILDDQNFDIITEGNIQQKFIESERGGLIEHLQTFFNNKNLKYHLILDENEETKDKTPKDRPIPPREQYQKMVEMYPLIKDLRDRLGMDLDY